MIDIAFDINEGNTFCNEIYPVVAIDQNAMWWDSYNKKAEEIIKQYSMHKVVIIQITAENFCMNKLALALFINGINKEMRLDLAVFKVKNLEQAINDYKPYLALSIAIKYILQIMDGSPEMIYKNISQLGYLGLLINTDYAENIMTLEYKGAESPKFTYVAKNIFEALVVTAVLKMVSLAKVSAHYEVQVRLNPSEQKIDIDMLTKQVIDRVAQWLD